MNFKMFQEIYLSYSLLSSHTYEEILCRDDIKCIMLIETIAILDVLPIAFYFSQVALHFSY